MTSKSILMSAMREIIKSDYIFFFSNVKSMLYKYIHTYCVPYLPLRMVVRSSTLPLFIMRGNVDLQRNSKSNTLKAKMKIYNRCCWIFQGVFIMNYSQKKFWWLRIRCDFVKYLKSYGDCCQGLWGIVNWGTVTTNSHSRL